MPTITVAGILVQGEGLLLCHHHDGTPFFPELWYAPAGYLQDEDESTEHALLRVLEERLGIFATEFEYIDSVYEQASATGERYIHNLYIVYAWEGEPSNLAPQEQAEIGWFTADDIALLPMADSVRNLLLGLYIDVDEEEVDATSGW